jgi:tungstate transport system substrate-binding protein
MPPRRRSPHPLVAGLLLALLVTPEAAAPQARTILLATTTSTQDSGLLDVLVPLFEKKTAYTVKTIAVGTGQSLALGARGEADVVLAHAPELERRYVAEGSLTNRRPVMHNDFILVGPPADPAGILQTSTGADAFRRIAEARARFVSRGDNSGTHHREGALWKAAGVTPGGPWYLESGQGMGVTLIIASEKDAYTLTDRGTYLAFQRRLRLALLLEGDAPLLNPYHVLEVNLTRHPKVNGAGGKAFADFLFSAEAQEVIRTFGVERYGKPLFFPDASAAAPGGG